MADTNRTTHQFKVSCSGGLCVTGRQPVLNSDLLLEFQSWDDAFRQFPLDAVGFSPAGGMMAYGTNELGEQETLAQCILLDRF